MNGNSKTKNITAVALMTALICVLSPITVPIGPVPLSLGTFAVYLTVCVLGLKKGVCAVAVYLAIGFIGLPVFTGFTGGIGKLFSATGGYLIGYLPMAVTIGLFLKFRLKVLHIAGLLLATLVLYAFGCAWYMFIAEATFVQAIAVTVLPFIIGDLIKIAAAFSISAALSKAIVKRQ